jgi:endonuclease/exonuclease/phosphatase family metal-dependent hydrolase
MDILDASALFQRQPEQPFGSPAELTYHSTQPVATIDWILVPKNCQIVEYRVEPATLSDHRPVVADLSLELMMNEAPSPK